MRRLLNSALVGISLWLVAGGHTAQPLAAANLVASSPQSAPVPQATDRAADLGLPNAKDSLKFVAMGDMGTGDASQYEVAKQMVASRARFPFDFVIMLGDNIYGSHHPNDFTQKFELPYKPMLDAGVKFYAALGNHDDPNDERLYKPFNMGGERYYAFKKGDVAFFALDSNYMDPNQLSWIDQNLQNTKSKWKICYFHHPLYNEGRSHGPDLDLRTQLTPLFKRYGVNLVLSGHEHVYERIKPQDNIYYLVLGNSAKLMSKDLKSSDQMQKGFDSDRGFMLIEIGGDKLYFQVISRTGQTIDAGVFDRQAQPSATSATVH